jgi:predicted Zn-dependent protease with MMP-like domain
MCLAGGHAHSLPFQKQSRAAPQRDSRQPGATADNEMVIEVEPGAFEDMVVAALDSLPEDLGQLMRNVAVTVEHGPGRPGLLGLYQGIPLTSRTSQYAGVLPDRITIYRRAICAICNTEAEVLEQVRRTVIHEVGHHFGIDDDRLSELGW